MISRTELRGFEATLVTDVLRVVARGVLILAMTRVFFSSREYGVLFFAISVLSVALLFADLGIAKSCARYLSTYRERDETQIPHILEKALVYRLAAITVVSVLFVLFGDSLAAALGTPESAPLLLLGAGYVACRSLKSFTVVVFQGFNRVNWSALVNATDNVGQLVFVVGFVALGFGTVGAMAGYVASAAVAAVVGLAVLYWKFYRASDRAETAEQGLGRRVRRYSVPLIASRSATVLDSRVDTVLLGVLVNPVAVGYYTLGKQITDFLKAPAASLGFTVAPTYAQHKEDGDLDHAARVYERTFEYVLLLYTPAAVGMVLLAEPGIRTVFGRSYLGAVPVVEIFGGLVLLQAIDKITNDGLDYLGRSRERAIMRTAAALSNFLLNLALIPTYGVIGAAAATVATFLVLVAGNVAIIYHELPIRPGRIGRTALQVSGVGAAMGLVLHLVLPYVSSVVTLAGAVLLGCGVWAGLSVLTGLIERETIAPLIP